jgi:hypothetical protein
MDATRARLSFPDDHLTEHLHQAVVAAGVVLVLIVAALFVREIRFVPRTFKPAASAAAAEVPAAIVSVPTLALAAGQVRVGDERNGTLAAVAAQQLLNRIEERGPLGVREIRAYAGFTLVFEPFERAGEPRVAAIYLQ